MPRPASRPARTHPQPPLLPELDVPPSLPASPPEDDPLPEPLPPPELPPLLPPLPASAPLEPPLLPLLPPLPLPLPPLLPPETAPSGLSAPASMLGLVTTVPYSKAPRSLAVRRGTAETGSTYSKTGVSGKLPPEPSATPFPIAGEPDVRW